MMRVAFSTVACPEWTLERVASGARDAGFDWVELRTTGERGDVLACDPCLTHDAKVRRLFAGHAVGIVSLGTSVRFDEPVRPPVIGWAISDTERSVRDGMRMVDLAIGLECPFVRVFAFELAPRMRRKGGVALISRRLCMVLDHANNTGVRLVLENGGSFPKGTDVRELVAHVDHPLLGACYSLAPAHAAGEDPGAGIDALGDRLWSARIKDLRAGRPCPLGEGELPCRRFVRALVGAGLSIPLVYEWDRAWVGGLAPASAVLPGASRSLHAWIAEGGGALRPASRRAGAVV